VKNKQYWWKPTFCADASVYISEFLDINLAALFHGQRLFGRAMSVRLDRWNDVKPQTIPRMLPAGLESVGMGLGVGGQPLQNIGQIASLYLLPYHSLTLWRPLLPYGYSYRASCARPSFVILTSSPIYKWQLNPVWHMMLYSCTHMATVGVKGLICSSRQSLIRQCCYWQYVIWLFLIPEQKSLYV